MGYHKLWHTASHKPKCPDALLIHSATKTYAKNSLRYNSERFAIHIYHKDLTLGDEIFL
jgi:hypothetical protein